MVKKNNWLLNSAHTNPCSLAQHPRTKERNKQGGRQTYCLITLIIISKVTEVIFWRIRPLGKRQRQYDSSSCTDRKRRKTKQTALGHTRKGTTSVQTKNIYCQRLLFHCEQCGKKWTYNSVSQKTDKVDRRMKDWRRGISFIWAYIQNVLMYPQKKKSLATYKQIDKYSYIYIYIPTYMNWYCFVSVHRQTHPLKDYVIPNQDLIYHRSRLVSFRQEMSGHNTH